MIELHDPDAPERLSPQQLSELEAHLRELGWVYLRGTGGIHRAERLGTDRQEQAALTADGLLVAVKQREEQLRRAEPKPQVHTGLSAR